MGCEQFKNGRKKVQMHTMIYQYGQFTKKEHPQRSKV